MSSRTCAKPGCNTSASATLTYDYSNRTATVERLDVEAHPMRYDLCAEPRRTPSACRRAGRSRTVGCGTRRPSRSPSPPDFRGPGGAA